MSDQRPRYPGAQPFPDDQLSRILFHGRDQESIALTNQILANRLVVLFARSGLGKTSLLNAGVAERLRAESFLPLTARVNDTDAGALGSVLNGIEMACVRQGIEYNSRDKTTLWRFLKTAEFWREDNLLEPVLILDQFEELFTLQSESERGAFVDQLSYVVRGVRPNVPGVGENERVLRGPMSDSPPPVRIVISLREDFLAYLEEMSDRIPGILDHRFRLLPLSRSAATRALERPAGVENAELATRPFGIDPQTTEAILSFLERRNAACTNESSNYHIEPFQLQLICQYVEEVVKEKQSKAKGGYIRVNLKDLGGEFRLRKILKDFYNTQICAVPSILQRMGVRKLCSEYLISYQGRRLRLEESEIKRLTGVKPTTLWTLVDHRLLRSDQSPDGIYYELSHDSLIKPALHSRRWWFAARAIVLLPTIVLGTVLGFVTAGGFAASMLADLRSLTVLGELFWILLAVSVFCVSAFFIGRWSLRRFREARYLLWRSRI